MRYYYLFFLISTLSIGQSRVTKGVVVPNVKLEASDSTDFALFLPVSYTETKKYPVVFVFDELGRGASAVQQFSIAAGLTESIIVSPNYKLNDDFKIALQESGRFVNKVSQLYAVDEDRIILSGFGKGALVVTSRAQLDTSIYGVIAIGDAYLDNKALRSNEQLKVALLSPDESGQFYKLRSYSRNYAFRKQIVSYHVYDGNDWPGAGFIAEALTAILLEDTTSLEKVENYYDSDMAFGTVLYRQQEFMLAHDFVSSLKSKYKKRIDIEEQKELIKKIKTNNTYRVIRSFFFTQSYEEDLLAEDFQYNIKEDMNNAFFDNLGWWGYQMDTLDEHIDSSETSDIKRKVALRLKRFVQSEVEAQYLVIQAEKPKQDKLLFGNILRTLVDPNNQPAFLEIISLSAREGDTNASLFYLEELLKTGYADYESLYAINYTTALRISPEWNEIVNAYLGKSKYY